MRNPADFCNILFSGTYTLTKADSDAAIEERQANARAEANAALVAHARSFDITEAADAEDIKVTWVDIVLATRKVIAGQATTDELIEVAATAYMQRVGAEARITAKAHRLSEAVASAFVEREVSTIEANVRNFALEV